MTPSTNSAAPVHRDRHPAAYRVLLVEHDDDNRDMYEIGLQSQGFSVVPFANGLRAFEEAFQTPPDVVVTDLAIPGIDGAELCRRLRENERTNAVPTIILTGRDARDIKRGYSAPDYADLFLLKPCEPNRLGEEIRGVITRSHVLRQRTIAVRVRAHESGARAAEVQARTRAEYVKWRQRISSDEAVRRIRADYIEMPGLRATVEQGARLWNLDKEDCAVLLSQLVELGFLDVGADSRYFRR